MQLEMTNTSDLFAGQRDFNEAISGWDVANVTMKRMPTWRECSLVPLHLLEGANGFNQSLGAWNVSNTTNMTLSCPMFKDARSFNQPLGAWNVSNGTAMHTMFSSACSLNQPLKAWNVAKVCLQRWYGIFAGAGYGGLRPVPT